MKRKKGSVGFKLDFKKAYDSLEWEFILAVLRVVGFDQKFVDLIYQCISTVQFTLLLNGTKSTSITPSRGLRQGDPLSPYLFILCADVLAKLINREVARGSITGVKLGVGAASITKLFYADDVLLFCGAKVSEVDALMKCLEKYCLWSGQSISVEKSGIFASKGVHRNFISQVKNEWGFKQLSQGVKYLGVPLFLTKNKSKDFAYVKEKLEARTNGWKSKNLSWMGRATLIKSVAQSAPVYTMAMCRLPKKLCSDLDGIVRKFWWSPKKSGNKYYSPVAWKELCQPLSVGGLGFRSFESFNEAMIAKLAWWVLSGRDSFCIKVLTAKYHVGSKWLNSPPARSASFAWRGIERAKSLLARGACKLVGSGDSILVWSEPWVPGLTDFIPLPKASLEEIPCLAVSQLMNQAKTDWNMDTLTSLFDSDTIQAIQNIPRWRINQMDKWIWMKTTNGEFSVKSAFKEVCREAADPEVNALMNQIWKSSLHQRLKMLLWRIAVGALPTRDSLSRFLTNFDNSCPLCNSFCESVVHVFWQCELARALWFGICGIRTEHFHLASAANLVEVIVFPLDDLVFPDYFLLQGTLILDLVWKARNSKVYDEGTVEVGEIMNNFRRLWSDHCSILRASGTSSSLSNGNEGWVRPNFGIIKINCDAAVGPRFSSIAVVARDWRGKLVFAFSKKVETILPLQAEAEAIIWAGQLAIAHDLSKVIVESDCKICVEAVNRIGSCPWLIKSGMLIFVDLMSGLSWWNLCWVRRVANRAPHDLAKWSLQYMSWGPLNFCTGPQSFVSICNEDLSGS
uniref:Reverse transcriptase domain-containing protein n=1 Tax=Fagus sylvatica TaxID=28930 RepID=A0A2N9G7C7_FAGSY